MSTRATIQFKDEYDTFFVYRHCDGYPEQIMPDIERVIENAHGRWSGSECGMFVSFFLGSHFDPKARLPEYMMTTYWHGDESYQYYVEWNKDREEWKARVSSEIIDPDTERRVRANGLEGQLQRARELGECSYSKQFPSDADLIKFLMDRLERVERVNSKAHETIRQIDWAL